MTNAVHSKNVLLIGATGALGNALSHELLNCPQFRLIVLIRQKSLERPRALALKDRGVEMRVGDVAEPPETLVQHLKGVDIVIMAISPDQVSCQNNVVDAAKIAGVKRFVPCSFSTICPVGGVLKIRDDKEVAHQYMFKNRIPYTIIDTGIWYQATFPQLPSGRVEYAMIDPNTDIFGDGNTRNSIIDLADVARYTTLIIDDIRTLNKKVFCYGQIVTQNEVMQIMEDVSGEKPKTQQINPESHLKAIADAEDREPGDHMSFVALLGLQYNNNQWIRGDNVPEYAQYLGYLDARDLYPGFNPRSFKEFATTLLAGKEICPYIW